MTKLIGTNPNQVPSNADLGTAAFMDKREFLLSKGSSLSTIDAVIPKTAVDVIIYDTSKDSDGGAWRKRTQHTSWYNERLNTSVRGNRPDFPAVAVLVLEANNTNVQEGQTVDLTIYDADDPNLPMWMEVRFGISGDGSSNTCVSALNGHIVFGRTNNGICILDFISDTLRIHNHVHRHTYSYISPSRLGRTAPRSVQKEMSVTGFNIINEYVNDVAMTVTPDSNMHVSGSLPVPTIAVATNGGVAVIKSDYTIVKITASAGSAYTGVSWIDFTENHNLIFEQDNSTNPRSVFCIPIPEVNRTTSTNDGDITDKVIMKWYSNGAHEPYPCFNGGGVVEAISMNDDNQAMRSSAGDLTILNPDFDSPEQGKVAYIASDYNTGWQIGNSKLATLSDTDSNDATDSNLVSNGTFDSNIDGWASSGASISWSSGRLAITSAGGNQPCYYPITCEIGKRYYVQLDFQGSWSFHLGTGSNAANDVGYIPHEGTTSSVTRHMFFTATQTTHYLVPYAIGANTVYVDNVIVKLAEDDRSVYGGYNGNGLETIGTVKKTPVTGGAELVAYSGFTLNNYLLQPIDSFSIDWSQPWVSHFWCDTVGKISIENQNTGGYNNTVLLASINSTGITTRSKVASGAWDQTYAVSNSGWIHVAFVYSGRVLTVYRNGIEVSKYAGTLTDQSAYISYGVNSYNGSTFPSSFTADTKLALHRISATAPSAEQIMKIYEDEKVLFQENAKCTLYGTSNVVTAFGYDSSTRTLHAGTSAGRSEFRGLQRINNTTRAVGTAISAVNGFVVEE